MKHVDTVHTCTVLRVAMCVVWWSVCGRPLCRMVVGMSLAAASFFSAAILNAVIEVAITHCSVHSWAHYHQAPVHHHHHHDQSMCCECQKVRKKGYVFSAAQYNATVSTSSWHVSFTRLCPARHIRTWLTTYTWFWKVQDVDSARPPTDRVLFHGRTTHLATEALLPPGHVFGIAFQYTCATKTSVITVFRVNLKRFGFSVASRAQCDIPINCAIQILWLTN